MLQESARCEWIILQITDTNFPAGSLGNSNGLESAVAHGQVTSGSARSLFEFLLLVLEQNAGQMLPFLRAAYRTVERKEVDTGNVLIALDAICHANISNESSIRSSITQGKCFLKACEACFGHGVYNSLMDAVYTKDPTNVGTGADVGDQGREAEFERVVACLHRSFEGIDVPKKHQSGKKNENRDEKVMQGHYPVVFGAVSAALGLPLPMACRAFMRCVLRDICSCATRLNIVGPLEGSNIQAKLSAVVEEMISAKSSPNEREVLEDEIFGAPQLEGLFSEIPSTSSPMIDMVQSRHDLLYSRLFNS